MKSQNYDIAELEKFSSLAAHWWDTTGDLKTLHQLNPLRLGFIKEKISLADKQVIDVGCGGGILSESMAEEKAKVTGIDLSKAVIAAAKLHLLESGLQVTYRHHSVEDMANDAPHSFDVITCFELLEHVPDPLSVIRACAQLAKPGAHVFFSTINRNPKSYLFAILGAEYFLKLLPKDTHDYAKFIRPAELSNWCREVHLTPRELIGVSYHPLSKQFYLTKNISVNYILYAQKNT